MVRPDRLLFYFPGQIPLWCAGNFYRIRSAFDLGARKLGKILQVPANSAVPEVNQFFRNTLKRNHTMVRPDVQDIAVDFNVERDNMDSSPLHSNSFSDLSDQFNNISISDLNNGSLKEKEQNPMVEHEEMKSVSNPVTSSISMRDGSDLCEAAPSTSEILPSRNAHYAQHLLHEPGNAKGGVNYDTNPSHHGMTSKRCTGNMHGDENSHPVENCLTPGIESDSNGVHIKEVGGDVGTTNDILSDLTGDHGTNFNNLLYAQGCHQDYPMNHDYPVNQVYYQMPAPSPAQYQNNHLPNGHSRKNGYGYAGTSGMSPGSYPPGYFVLRPFYQPDDPMRARGTGTYFPDPVCSLFAHSYAYTTESSHFGLNYICCFLGSFLFHVHVYDYIWMNHHYFCCYFKLFCYWSYHIFCT